MTHNRNTCMPVIRFVPGGGHGLWCSTCGDWVENLERATASTTASEVDTSESRLLE